jgi:hypothetical protein
MGSVIQQLIFVASLSLLQSPTQSFKLMDGKDILVHSTLLITFTKTDAHKWAAESCHI